MNTSLGYSKRTLDDTKVLLSGGGDKLLSDFIGSISWDAENRKLKYTPVGGTATDLVTFGSNALNSTSYLPLAGGTMSSGAIIYLPNNSTIKQTQNDTSNYTALIHWLKNSTGWYKNDGTTLYSYQPQIGQHNTGDTYGTITLLPYATDTSPWKGTVGLYIGKTVLKWEDKVILHADNYTSYKHAYTNLTGSGTTANQAIVSNGTANGWTLKTLGSRAFDSTAYLPLAGGQMTGPLTWKNSTALPEQTSPEYFLVIDAFASGGTTKWSSVANVKTALGLGSNAYTSTAYLPLTGGTLTNSTWGAQLNILRSGGAGNAVIKYSNANDGVLGYIGITGSASSFGKGVVTFHNGSSEYEVYHSGNLPAYPTKASWNYDDVYVKSVSISSNNLRINKNGTNTDLTIPYATNADKLDGYHADDILPYGLENLCVGAVAKGGQTTLNSDGSITTSGTNSDTYFYVSSTENLTAGQIYTVGFYVTGVPSENTKEWWFPFAAQSNSNLIVKIKSNGWCWGTGTIPNDITAGTNIIFDDSTRNFYNSINISKFVIVKGRQKAYYTPPISKMSVASATKATKDSDGNAINSTYLKLSGGTITTTSVSTLMIERTGGANAAGLGFKNTNGVLGYIGMTGSVNGSLIRWNTDASSSYTILDSGNSSVSLSGSTLTVKINGTSKSLTNTNSTYPKAVKNITRSGTTFTATCYDDTTFTFTQQDNNTTYSAGYGLTLSSTTFTLGHRWTAKTQGLKWSRIMYGETKTGTVGCNGILTLRCTRANVVANATFLVTTSHSSYGQIVPLSSNSYTPIRSRILVNSTGNFYIELYDTAQSIASGTSQDWYCTFVPLSDITVTTYTAFTDGYSVPSGYTAQNDFTTTVGDDALAIKSISRNGTTFTATRLNGSTFTFTQQDSNTTYTIATGDSNGQIKVTPSSGSAYNVSVKGLGSNAYSSTSYLPLAGGTMTGQLTFASGQNKGFKFANGTTFDIAGTTDGGPVMRGGYFRFTNGTDWDYSSWAGLGYNTTAKTIYLGIPGDGTIFQKNQRVDTGGKLQLTNISSITLDGASGNTYKVWHENNDGSGSGLDADLLDGYHSMGGTHPNWLYKHYQAFSNATAPTADWFLKIVLDVNWNSNLTNVILKADYSNRAGTLYLDLDSAAHNWRLYHTNYSTNFLALKRVHNTTNGDTEIYVKLAKPTDYNGNTYKGDIKVWSPVTIKSITVVSDPGDLIALSYGYNATTPIVGEGFKRLGSSDTYVLLGGGGHKLVSDFATSGHTHDGRYMRKFGTVSSGNLFDVNVDPGSEGTITYDPTATNMASVAESNPNVTALNLGDNFARRKQLLFTYNNDNIYYRRKVDNTWSTAVKLIHSGNISSQSVDNAHKLDDWHLYNILQTGFVCSNTASLSSYWAKAWTITVTNRQYADQDVVMLLDSAFMRRAAIILIKIRQQGANGGGAYNFDFRVFKISGNIPNNIVRLSVNNSTGVCDLWINCEAQYGCYNITILKKNNNRYGHDCTALGTLTTESFATAQSVPALGTTCKQMESMDQEVWNLTAGNNVYASNYVESKGTMRCNYLDFWTTDQSTVAGYVGRGSSNSNDLMFANYGNNKITFYTNNATRMVITGGGDIGIGTASPSYKLHVNGAFYASASSTINGNITASGQVKILGSADAETALRLVGSQYQMDFLIGSGNVNRGIYDRTGNKWALYFDASNTYLNYGDVVPLGSVVPSADNSKNLGSTSNYWKNVYHYNSCIWEHVNVGYQLGHQSTNRAEISLISRTDLPCDLMLGSNSAKKWSITCRASGESYMLGFYNYTSAGYAAYINGTNFTCIGNVYATNFYTTSDARMKKDISSISEHVRKFKLKLDDSIHYGFIAQEVEIEHPELVDNSGDHKTVDYNSTLSLLLAKAENKIKELENRIKLLEDGKNS